MLERVFGKTLGVLRFVIDKRSRKGILEGVVVYVKDGGGSLRFKEKKIVREVVRLDYRVFCYVGREGLFYFISFEGTEVDGI